MNGGYLTRKEEVDREIAAMRRAHKKLMRSKKKIRQFLIEGGFMTEDGKLTKRYGG